MKKFSRCALILILVAVLGAVGGYFYADKTLTPVYSSETVLYVVVDESSEASLRSKDGGLNDDFEMLIKGSAIISEAQRSAGTSESIDKYLQVVTPANSNIIKIICNNPDAQTAKTYVDAVARATVNSIGNTIPVKSVKIMNAGTVSSKSYKPDLYTYTAAIAGLAAAACLVVEILVLLCMSAFRKKEDNSDDESEYERRYGNVVYLPASENFSKSTRRNDDLSNDDGDIEIENDDAKEKTIAAKTKKSDEKINVSDEEPQAVEEEPAAVQPQEEPPAVKEQPITGVKPEDDIFFEEPVIGEAIINEAAVALEEPQEAYGVSEDAANASAYGAEKETSYGVLYGTDREAAESIYGSMKETSKESVYGSMPQEIFAEAENEAAAAKSETFSGGFGTVTGQPESEPVTGSISSGAEQLKAEPIVDITEEEPEDLPVMDTVLQAQQPVSSQYVYKEEAENASSTATVSSKYLYKGDESYRKPVSEPAENKRHIAEYSEDIGMDDISEVQEKGKKKSRIIGIIRK